MRDGNLVKQNGDRVRYVPKYGHESEGNLEPIQINLYKEELRSYKRKASEKEKTVKEEQHQLSDQIFEKEEEVGVDPLLEAKRQMYENQAMSNEAALGIKKNNEKLMKNINRLGDISRIALIQTTS